MNDIYPMLAKDAGRYFKPSSEWLCQPKYDGCRYILQFNANGTPRLTSRQTSVRGGLVDKTEHLLGTLYQPGDYRGLTLDGELVINGSFTNTVKVMGSSVEKAHNLLADAKVEYHVFDCLAVDGENIETLPLEYRLSQLVAASINARWEVTPNLPLGGEFEHALDAGFEGVVYKLKASAYHRGSRSSYWLKRKAVNTYDGFVTGFQPGKGKFAGTFGALIISQYVNGVPTEVATISGMPDGTRYGIWDARATYLGACVEFKAQARLPSGRYRHPRFLRLRLDKQPEDCVA